MTLTVLTDRAGYIGPPTSTFDSVSIKTKGYNSLDPDSTSLEALHRFLPPPARTAVNAKNHLEWLLRAGVQHHGNSFEVGHMSTDHMFKVSLRTVQELLGAPKDVKSFEDMHGLRRNPFLRNLEEGRLITKIEVEKGTFAEVMTGSYARLASRTPSESLSSARLELSVLPLLELSRLNPTNFKRAPRSGDSYAASLQRSLSIRLVLEKSADLPEITQS